MIQIRARFQQIVPPQACIEFSVDPYNLFLRWFARACAETWNSPFLKFGQIALSGCKKTYFVVWTIKGARLIEVINFEAQRWKTVLPNLIYLFFFKTYVQRVLLGLRDLYYCPACDKVCLELDDFEEDNENSLQCESCSHWYHWGCVGVYVNEITCPEQYVHLPVLQKHRHRVERTCAVLSFLLPIHMLSCVLTLRLLFKLFSEKTGF